MASPQFLAYSDSQQKAIFWAGKPSSVLGICTSAFIAFSILRDQKTLKAKVFRRLFLGMCVGHIAMIAIQMLSSIPMPAESELYASFGNEQSCRAVGFLSHVAFSTTMAYNGAVGVYYYIVFCHNWSDSTIKKTVEHYLHAIALLYPLIGAVVGVSLNLYNASPLLMQCWVHEGPVGCDTSDEIECTRGNQYKNLFIWLTGMLELNWATSIKMATVFKICYNVYTQEKKNQLRASQLTYAPTSSMRNSQNTGTGTRKEATTISFTKPAPVRSRPLMHETFVQSCLFLVSCFLPYGLNMILKFIDMYWVKIPQDSLRVPTWIFVIAFASQIAYPCQGLVNVVIFLRPSYMARRRTTPNESTWNSIRATVYESFGWQVPTSFVKASTTITSTSQTERIQGTISSNRMDVGGNSADVDGNREAQEEGIVADGHFLALSYEAEFQVKPPAEPSPQQEQFPEEAET